MTAWLRRRSFRVRLGALVAAAVGATVILAALAAYIAVHHRLYDQIDSSLNGDVSALSSSGAIDPSRVGGVLRRYTNVQIQIVDASGSATNMSSTAGFAAPTLPVNNGDVRIASEGPNADSSFRDVSYQGQRYRLLTVGALLDDANGTQSTGALQIAVPLTDVDRTLSDLRLIFWLVTIGGVAVAVGLGYLVGRATIRPVERLTAAAEHVAMTQDLSATIDDQGEDELARLGHAFNQMLGALAASRQQMAQLISDAGHELRTPLTSLRTNIEVLLRVKELPDADRADLLVDVHAQLEEMTTLIGDVVELGREDELQEPIEVRFDSLVARAVERARRRAPSVRFEVDLTPGSVRAQPTLLERAILNILDNAAKFSPADGVVRVWLRRDHYWTLDVLDQGPGISPDDLPRVFDRFYRADSARALPGSGLGLAIVRQVISSHGGSVSASIPPGGGTLIHIELPIVAEQEPGPDAASPGEQGAYWPPPVEPANGADHPYGDLTAGDAAGEGFRPTA